jgi:hypothetical protein
LWQEKIGMNKAPLFVIGLLAFTLAFASSAFAFSIKPAETDQDKRLRAFEDRGNWFFDTMAGAYIDSFTQPVHEEAIQRM